MKTIYEALEHIRNNAKNEKEKGTNFERLARFFLKNDPLWSTRFSEVYLWDNAPTNDGVDIGIDIVALDAEDGTYWAIQCKCYDDDATLHYGEVATFYGKTGNKGKYGHTMLITTAGKLSEHLETVADDWGTVRIFSDDIAESEMDFEPWLNGKNTTHRILHEVLPHQREAINDCLAGYEQNDRGQLIMACGTGKTLTSLRLTEELLEKQGKKGGRVLFLAPSIALVGQSMRSWANQSKLPLVCAVVCSDTKASSVDEDTWESALRDLPYPASTDSDVLYKQMKSANDSDSLVVIFSTYQSIQVVADAQRLGLPEFDIVICDEAHRTTGANEKTAEASEFVKVHDNDVIAAKKRLYMTATPKIYGDRIKKMAKADSYVISSMDDIDKFGPEFHHLSFGRAVDEKLLTDYKVIALTMPESVVSEVYQRAMAEEEDGFDITESARIIGCWKGLLDQGEETGKKLKNAVAFCSTIAESLRIAEHFQKTVDAYIDYEKEHGNDLPEFRCKIEHVDGGMDAKTRSDKIKWLANTENGDNASCHILSNARCLAEGVDVPNLDAVLFLQPKKSQIDITQAVGRVMRKFEGKEFGYIILPIVIPAGLTAEEALDDNETYATVWDVLKALRSHDERLDARINAIPFDKGNVEPVVKVVDGSVSAKDENEQSKEEGTYYQYTLNLSQAKLQEAVNALIVKKCGTKVYWDIWAKDIARIAKRHIERISEIVVTDESAGKEFKRFLRGLRDSLNDSITEEQAVEMLAQHIITLPVFEALFGGADFAGSNPVSVAMEKMLSILRKYTLETDEEKKELDELYRSVRMRAEGIRTDAGRQAVVKELYESFFKEAFKATSEKMGIVYTPNQVVDYILHATDRLLYKEFGQHLSDKDVHILDAFTGTGTFIVNLINDEELMPTDKLAYKYENEIHCNEIMLLAYYIATINIEHAFHDRMGGDTYQAFPGAVLTDTFQMYEEGDPVDRGMFIQNTVRGLTQMSLPIHVLVGNPPWSAKQESVNDNNANECYPTLDKRISETYVANSEATNKNSIYDSYIRAFRWASDRIEDRGIISFVTNGGWLKSNSASGFRKCLAEEFNSIYVFDLRGNQRTQGEQSRKEGGKIFGSGSRASVVITLLVKNPESSQKGVIYYHDVGDYLKREEKLSIIGSSINGEIFNWENIQPDKYGDWLDQRDDSWYDFAPLGINNKIGKIANGIFECYSRGIETGRDNWIYGYSPNNVSKQMESMIQYYNQCIDLTFANEERYDKSKIKWTSSLENKAKRNQKIEFKKDCLFETIYRPFCKEYLYWDEEIIHRPGIWRKCFSEQCENKVIVVMGKGDKDFSCIMVNTIPDVQMIFNGQCFPLNWYEKISAKRYKCHDVITDEALEVFRKIYPNVFDDRLIKNGGKQILKEDIFYYIYAILHSPEYRERFGSNLKKEIPRIPLSNNFKEYSISGRMLAEIHTNYEMLDLYPLEVIGNEVNPGPVQKMKWGKKKSNIDGEYIDDESVLIYNANLTFKEIPKDVERYKINGRSPLEWIIERYQINKDSDTGIINDPNDYSEDPCYIVKLIRRLVTLSVRTMEIIDNLPPINEMPQPEGWPEMWKMQNYRIER